MVGKSGSNRKRIFPTRGFGWEEDVEAEADGDPEPIGDPRGDAEAEPGSEAEDGLNRTGGTTARSGDVFLVGYFFVNGWCFFFCCFFWIPITFSQFFVKLIPSRSLTFSPLKIGLNAPIGSRIIFQPAVFRGELLNFGGVTWKTFLICEKEVLVSSVFF